MLILVENVEHALALTQRLPGWRLRTGADVIEDGLSRGRREVLAKRRALKPRRGRTITTFAGLDRLDVTKYDVLIRADGGRDLPAALTSKLSTKWDSPSSLVLIDYVDRHHPVLRRYSRERRKGYAARGWSVDGQPVPTDVEPLSSPAGRT